MLSVKIGIKVKHKDIFNLATSAQASTNEQWLWVLGTKKRFPSLQALVEWFQVRIFHCTGQEHSRLEQCDAS